MCINKLYLPILFLFSSSCGTIHCKEVTSSPDDGIFTDIEEEIEEIEFGKAEIQGDTLFLYVESENGNIWRLSFLITSM